MKQSAYTNGGKYDAETVDIVMRILSELDMASSEPAITAPQPVPKPQPPANAAPKHKVCKDCRERLPLGAYLKDGRGGRRAECAACYHVRYRGGRAGYRHRYSYKSRRAK